MKKLFLSSLFLISLPAFAQHILTPPFLQGITSVESYENQQNQFLKDAQVQLDNLLAVKGKRTIENTLTIFDRLQNDLEQAGSQLSLIENVHPDSAFRSVSEKLSQKVSAFATQLSLNRPVYDAINSIDLTNADQQTKYYIDRTLLGFRLSGIDKDEVTREKIRKVNEELVLISQNFTRNTNNGVRTITVKNESELEGMPIDFIKGKKKNADGSITLTTNYPDALPIFKYAKNDDVRKQMYIAYNTRAYPENMSVLDNMIAKRFELANLIGYDSWADYITADKMIGSAKNAADFIEKISTASDKKAKDEYQLLLDFKRKSDPNATIVNTWESTYLSEQYKNENYQFNSQLVRPYLPYPQVKQGLLDLTSKLFGVTFVRNYNTPVWDSSVECWEMMENGKIIGRLYLDMHPRPNKYNHAAQFGIRSGAKDKQIPEAALVCNFPAPTKEDPALMEFGDVQTFFHEFGHLIHTLFSGNQKWVGIGGIKNEWDFVEAPSQMLEEWTWDPKVLGAFAKHYQTGEVIPVEMIKKMKAASEYGKGMNVKTQMFYAKLSLSCYDQNPSLVNTDELVKALREKYTPFKHVPGTHMQTAFGHLDGYSAIYYTYMWSLVIAKDMFSKFDKTNLLDTKLSMEYRNKVLAPGGSKPAAELVKDFLGRPYNFSSWEKWLNEETK